MKPMLLALTRTHADYELDENHPLGLRRVAGRRIECLAGVAWITAYNQPEDVFLQPGEEFIIPNRGLLLLEAIGRCRVRIATPAPCRTVAMRPGPALSLQKLIGVFVRM